MRAHRQEVGPACADVEENAVAHAGKEPFRNGSIESTLALAHHVIRDTTGDREAPFPGEGSGLSGYALHPRAELRVRG